MLKLFRSKRKTARIKVLLVDDEPDLVSTVEYRLRFAECDVVTASNGQEGLDRAAAEKPDVILLDTNMPVMDGHEMLKHLRANPDLRDTPVIMFTARCEPQDISTASSLGIFDYITKPFDFSQLMDRVHAAVRRTKA